MLEIAKVGPGDYVIDLGSGDGRMVITAAKKHGARGFGVDLDRRLVALANRNAARAGVADRAVFYERDLHETDVSPAYGHDHLPAAGSEPDDPAAGCSPRSSPARASCRTTTAWASGRRTSRRSWRRPARRSASASAARSSTGWCRAAPPAAGAGSSRRTASPSSSSLRSSRISRCSKARSRRAARNGRIEKAKLTGERHRFLGRGGRGALRVLRPHHQSRDRGQGAHDRRGAERGSSRGPRRGPRSGSRATRP